MADSSLLSGINGFDLSRLKKTQTNDRSAPIIPGSTANSNKPEPKTMAEKMAAIGGIFGGHAVVAPRSTGGPGAGPRGGMGGGAPPPPSGGFNRGPANQGAPAAQPAWKQRQQASAPPAAPSAPAQPSWKQRQQQSSAPSAPPAPAAPSWKQQQSSVPSAPPAPSQPAWKQRQAAPSGGGVPAAPPAPPAPPLASGPPSRPAPPPGAQNIAKLEEKVNSLESEVSDLQSQIKQLQSQLTQLQSTVTKLQQSQSSAASHAGASTAAASRAPKVQAAPARPRAKTATVTYDFQGDPGQGSMTVSAGETLNYEGNPSDDWIMCTRPSTGEQGYVPNTYLQF